MPIASGHIGAPAHEERRLVETAKAAGDVERRDSIPVARIDLGAAVKEDAQVRSVPKAAATCSGFCPYLSPTRGSTPRAISSSAMAGSHDPSAARNRSVLARICRRLALAPRASSEGNHNRVVLIDPYRQFLVGDSLNQPALQSLGDAHRSPFFPAWGMWTEISVPSREQSLSRVYTILGGLR